MRVTPFGRLLESRLKNYKCVRYEPSTATEILTQVFEVSPKHYLKYAKEDKQLGPGKGYVNAISNAKRAIDCMIDSALVNIFGNKSGNGIKYENYMKHIPALIEAQYVNSKLARNLKFTLALNLAPILLIRNVRFKRDTVEHDYVNPSIDDVDHCIGAADLFIRVVTSKLNLTTTEFEICDNDNEDNKISVFFDSDKLTFEITNECMLLNHEKLMTINRTDVEYFGLLRMMFSEDDSEEMNLSYNLLLRACGFEEVAIIHLPHLD